MKRSLVIGMGIGQLYKQVLTELGHDVITVDPFRDADYTNVKDALVDYQSFNTVHICTPNFTHLDLAIESAPYADIVFIEKPGVLNKKTWQSLIDAFPGTRFMMVKNNMWRNNIAELQQKASIAKNVDIEWIRKNCVPNPGSWFTTKELAYGGVSRDLMPHLLSLYIALNPKWRTDEINDVTAIQNWQLADIDSTEYGIVSAEGTYDVDDQCNMGFTDKWQLRSNWRSIDIERSAITFINQDNTRDMFELGWCPEEAYSNMIKDAIENLNNLNFWNNQLEIDLWIHERIENL